MVSVTHSVSESDAEFPRIEMLAAGLSAEQRGLLERAIALAEPLYRDRTLGTGEVVWRHALGTALICASLKLDTETRVAALLFAAAEYMDDAGPRLQAEFGSDIAGLVTGLKDLNGLRVITRMTATASAPEIRTQTEILRKMVLGMVADIRVVLIRLASRTQSLRFYTENPGSVREDVARESLDIYAPLANRLGVWQLKWELEDLSFRFLEPETYKRVAKMLDERRVERQQFIDASITRLQAELAAAGVKAEIYGRPKHIYSIYNKMRQKHLDFAQVYDIRALRVLVDDVRDCYTALGIAHQIWQPIEQEFDDYITKPKGNNYQSLHTAVMAGDGRALEVQIRTHEMHRHAELGIAAHWRYKEGGGGAGAGDYDEKIALLRSLLSWRDEVADSADWMEKFKRASLDDTIYVLTPQGRVIDLPRGATPVDFAYRVHSALGHRCRGAKVDGHLVSLNTALENGQTVEIVTAKEGGPSRDWINPAQGYVHTLRARHKIKQYFAQLEEEEFIARGRSFVAREMQREAHGQTSVDDLAGRLGFKDAPALYVAAGRGEVGPRAVQLALRGAAEEAEAAEAPDEIVIGHSHEQDSSDRILIVGVGKLLTSLARCCKPAPPDAIEGFVTRGRGISIHRIDCKDFLNMSRQNPERVIEAQWGERAVVDRQAVYPVDIRVVASDRQGLLRDISEVLSREKLNVIAVNTLSRKGAAQMRFTVEVSGVAPLQRAMTLIREVDGVQDATRG
jgi:GTP pyrophosphokinase